MKYIDYENLNQDYLKDESKKYGCADRIFFPGSESDIIKIMKTYPSDPITLQGSRTGVTAGCVPHGGIIVNLEKMNQILSIDPAARTAIVQPGVILQNLRKELERYQLVFSPDPTETSASIGGMIACNSSGARTYKNGPTRRHVLSLKMVLRNGDTICIDRTVKADHLHFEIPTARGSIVGELPDIRMPSVPKHTAGYYAKPDMDLLDLFIGSEGTLGIVTEATLKLQPASSHIWGAFAFLDSEPAALTFVHLLRTNFTGERKPEAIEFFGKDCLDLLRTAQKAGHALASYPKLENSFQCALYVEFASDSRSEMMEIFQTYRLLLLDAGGDPSRTWLATSRPALLEFKEIRHAAPACVNRQISQIRNTYPQITKLGTDMSVPDESLDRVFQMYRSDLQANGFHASVFGHIGNNHLHVNIIPRTPEEYDHGKELYTHWAEEITAMGGSVSSEHGIGKLKTWLLPILYSSQEMEEMKRLKQIFDPQMTLNQGNIFL